VFSELASITPAVKDDSKIRLDVGGKRLWLVEDNGKKLCHLIAGDPEYLS
jgi:hypothetical protein